MKRRVAYFLEKSFILFISILKIGAAVKCTNCRSYEKEIVCDQDCLGDFCVLWKWKEMSVDHKIQGCVTGVDTSRLQMGCRTNQAEATMCLCNSTDLCNREFVQLSTQNPKSTISLPETKCHSYTEAPYIQKVKKENFCPSDYCYFIQTNVTNYANESETMTSTSCGQMPQFSFDFLIGSLWPGPGLFANGCYMLQAQGKDTMLGCVCSTNGCNKNAPYKITPGDIHCHLAYGATSEDQLNAKEFCKGDFCILQRTVVPGYGIQWLKGCLSANESKAVGKLKSGYRNILGVEQWLCQTDFCNFDLESVHMTIPREASLKLFMHDYSGHYIRADFPPIVQPTPATNFSVILSANFVIIYLCVFVDFFLCKK